jgi:hypothetical protein
MTIEDLQQAYRDAIAARNAAWEKMSSAMIAANPWQLGDLVSTIVYGKSVTVRVTKIYVPVEKTPAGRELYKVVGIGYPVTKKGTIARVGEVSLNRWKDEPVTVVERAKP